MELNQVLFVDNLPSLDLHGFDRDTARVKVLEFIKDNIILKNDIICIVHGVGLGIVKEEVHNTLKRHKNVLEYKLFYNNVGCTIVKLKI
ncbi:MAG: Smr/MutS family protein [Bacilli bacterium]|nr:Smr/MutS family protein [Bacilli bacterium]